MKGLHTVTFILLVIGGLDWLLIGLNPDWNVVSILGGTVSRIVYLLVGLSAIYEIAIHKKICKLCNSGASAGPSTGGSMPR